MPTILTYSGPRRQKHHRILPANRINSIHADDVAISTVDTSCSYAGFLVEYFSIDNVVNEWLPDFNVNGYKLRGKVDTGAQTDVIFSSELNQVSHSRQSGQAIPN